MINLNYLVNIKRVLLLSLVCVCIYGAIDKYTEKISNDIKEKNVQVEEIKKELNDKREKIKEDKFFLDITNTLNKVKEKYGDSIGISYYDINNKRNISINEDVAFTAASTTKVPLVMVLYNKVQNGEIDLNETMQYEDKFFEGGTGILQNKDLSEPLKISMLAEYAIKYSDNIATNMLYEKLGGYLKVYEEMDKILGYKTIHNGNKITTKDANNYLKILYENKDNNKYYNELISTMKNTVFDMRLSGKIDKKIVAHKIGTYDGYINDIGIIYGDNPFIISTYTKDIKNADDVISEISSYIYEKQSKRDF